MLKRNKQHKKMNNKGITLVELIVAITILMLVSGTLLSAFVSSMRMSKKSRDLHRATTVAQNIMEGVKLKSAGELAYQFNYPVVKDTAGNDVSNFSVYLPDMFQYSGNLGDCVGELYVTTDAGGAQVLAKTNSISLSAYKALCADPTTNAEAIKQAGSAYTNNLTSKNYDFLEDTEGKYYYYLRNLENDGSYYNAKITIDASPYRAGGSSSLDVNSEKLISVPTIDSTYDAVEVMGQYDNEALNAFQLHFSTASIDETKIHRTITIKINNAAAPLGADKTKVTVLYDYEYNGWSMPTITSIPFDNEGNELIQPLRNIYLYYQPSYDRSSYLYRDDIVIENMNNKDVEVYIIKQEDDSLEQNVLQTKELSYKVDFNVRETNNNAQGNSHITLHTNWNQSLADVYFGTNTTISQVSWLRNGVATTQDTYQKTDIKDKKASDRMFDVTVEIYESSAAGSLSELQGADISTWFSEDKHLITITGSSSQ